MIKKGNILARKRFKKKKIIIITHWLRISKVINLVLSVLNERIIPNIDKGTSSAIGLRSSFHLRSVKNIKSIS